MLFLAAPTRLVAKLSKRIFETKSREAAETTRFTPLVGGHRPIFSEFAASQGE